MKTKKAPVLPYVPSEILGIHQEGGQVQMGTPAPMAEEPEAAGNPGEQLLMMAQQAVDNADCQMGLQVSQMVIDLINQMQAQGGAPGGEAAPPAPAEVAPGGGAPM